jgi:hypothetical protein
MGAFQVRWNRFPFWKAFRASIKAIVQSVFSINPSVLRLDTVRLVELNSTTTKSKNEHSYENRNQSKNQISETYPGVTAISFGRCVNLRLRPIHGHPSIRPLRSDLPKAGREPGACSG